MPMGRTATRIVMLLGASGFFLMLLTIGVLTLNPAKPYSAIGSDQNVDVFMESECVNQCEKLDWDLSAGSTSRTVYVKNTCGAPVSLSMFATGWAPSDVGAFLVMSWDREGNVLSPGESTSATLILTASENASNVENFSFRILITGS